jgi:uncharacterized protein (DUF1330 family)
VKTGHKFLLAVFGGILIGVAATTIYAQQLTKTPPGYVIAEVAVTDPAVMQKYGEQVPATMDSFDHQYVIRSDKTQSLEGEPPNGIVVIALDSVAKAREWYDSPAYAAIKPLREHAAKSRIFIVEGLILPPK